jgi:hypothetical protein
MFMVNKNENAIKRKKKKGGLNSCCYILPVKEFQFLGNCIKSSLFILFK